MPSIRYHKWLEFASLCYALYDLHQPTYMAVDTETTGLAWYDEPFGMSVAWQGPERIERFWFEFYDDDTAADIQQMAERFLTRHILDGRTMLFYNAKFDIRMLTNFGVLAPEDFDYVDVLAMAALLDPAGERGLKPVMRKYLGVTTNQAAAVKQASKELKISVKRDGYEPLPREVVVPYALMDAEGTLRLHPILDAKLDDLGVRKAFEKESRLVREMIVMERRGVLVDPMEARSAVALCDERCAHYRKQIELIVGMPVGNKTKGVKQPDGKVKQIPVEFNPASTPQKIAYFKTQGITLTSCKEKTLRQVEHRLVEPLLSLSKEVKLRNTYLIPLLDEMDEDCILHPNFNQFGTGTGRFSSSSARSL